MPRKRSNPDPRHLFNVDVEMGRELSEDPERDEDFEPGTEEEEISTDVSRRAESMQPDLYMAAKRGDTDFIKNLKAEDLEGPVVSQKTPQLNTVLHIAASLGHSQLVEAMLENDDWFWMGRNSAGELALHVAASCGQLSTLKKLVSVSGSVFLKAQNNEGNTALHLALINKYREVDLVSKTKFSKIAGFLVETNPEVSYRPNEEHKSPLYMAAEAGDAEMVKFMIEKADGINMAMVEGGGRILPPFDEVKLIAHAAITGRNIGKFTSYFTIFHFPAVSMFFSAIPIDKLLVVTKLLGY